jgi:hypothetical protein
MIYGYLLSEDDIQDITACSHKRLEKFPYAHLKPEKSDSEPGFKITDALNVLAPPPASMISDLTYAPFATELVDMLYETSRDLWIDSPSHIRALMNTDFFSLNRKLRDARLSALHISGLFDKGEPSSVRLSTLAADLKTLSNCTWAPNFEFNITFRTKLGFAYYHDRFLFRHLLRRFYKAWQILRPWIVEAEKRGARVQLIFLTRAKMYQYLYGENNMLSSEAEWKEELVDTLAMDATFFQGPPPKISKVDMVWRGFTIVVMTTAFVGTCCFCCFGCGSYLSPMGCGPCGNARRKRH